MRIPCGITRYQQDRGEFMHAFQMWVVGWAFLVGVCVSLYAIKWGFGREIGAWLR